MARAIWSGSIGFGLVNIPVRLFPATSPNDVRFHEFAAGTGRRIRHQRVVESTEERPEAWSPSPSSPDAAPGVEPGPSAPAERGWSAPPGPPEPARRPVASEDVVKGYEVEPGRYVMVDPEELRALRAPAERTIAIEGFVGLDEIDPVFFEKSYYAAPQHGAERPYALLLRTLERSRRVGIGTFVLRTREYLAAVRSTKGIVVVETLFFADEVRSLSEVLAPGIPDEVPERELTMAGTFVDLLAMEWNPERYADPYRERVMELIASKAGSATVVAEEAAEPDVASGPGVPAILEALRASVEEAKRRQAGAKRSSQGRRASGSS